MTKNKRRGGKVSRKKKEKEMKLLDKQGGRMFDVSYITCIFVLIFILI